MSEAQAVIHAEANPGPQAFNLMKWIEENPDKLKPPLGAKTIFREEDFMITVVGGPNTRTDYHVNPTEEFFFQLKGTVTVRKGLLISPISEAMSLRRDLGVLDHLGPARPVPCDQLGQAFGRTALGDEALRLERGPDIRLGQDLVEHRVVAIDHTTLPVEPEVVVGRGTW